MNVGFAVERTSSVLSPSLVLSSRAGFIRHDFYIATHGDNFDPGDASRRASRHSSSARRSCRSSGTATARSAAPSAATTAASSPSDTSVVVEVSKTSGNHSFKFGGELRALVNNQQNPTSSTGRFTFNRAFTQRNALAGSVDAGSSVASLLLGYPADGSTTTCRACRRSSRSSTTAKYFGLFVQDDWRINPRLTLNAGLRWDYESPVVEDLNQQNIGFDTTSPSTFQVPGLSLTGGRCSRATTSACPSRRISTTSSPGPARPSGSTTRRCCAAATRWPICRPSTTATTTGSASPPRLVASTDGGITPTGRLSNPFPAGLDQPVGSSQGLDAGRPRLHLLGSRRTIPYVHQFSVACSVSCRAAWRWTCRTSAAHARSAGVQGDQRDHRRTARDGPSMPSRSPIRIRASCRGRPSTRHGAAAAARASLLQFAAINEDRRPFGVNDYDALQISVNKRISSGLQFLVSYTYSRTEEEVTYLNPQDDFGSVDARRHRPTRRIACSSAAPMRCRSSRTRRA